MKFFAGSVCLESIELVFNLIVDVLIFTLGFATLSFYNPDSTVFLHYNVVRIGQSLLLNTINRDDRENIADWYYHFLCTHLISALPSQCFSNNISQVIGTTLVAKLDVYS